jgi:hypothetical protein
MTHLTLAGQRRIRLTPFRVLLWLRVDTWETLTCSYTNATAVDKWYVIRMLGKNATGNVYSLLNVESGGSGGVRGVLGKLSLHSGG